MSGIYPYMADYIALPITRQKQLPRVEDVLDMIRTGLSETGLERSRTSFTHHLEISDGFSCGEQQVRGSVRNPESGSLGAEG